MKTKSLAQSIALALMLAFSFQFVTASLTPCYAEEAAAAAPAEGEEVIKETGLMPAVYSWLCPGLGQWYARGFDKPMPKKTIGHCLLSGGLMIIGLGFIPWIISIWDAYTGRTDSWLNGYL